MKKRIYVATMLAIALIYSCKPEINTMNNPFFSEYNTPFDVPPFESISAEHYKPALDSALKLHLQEVDAIINSDEAANFENTIVALDQSGELLKKVLGVFFGQKSADATEELQAISGEIRATFSAHLNELNMNEDLFRRVEAVYQQKDDLDLNPEQISLLDKEYQNFIRNGVNLQGEDKEKLKTINLRLTELTNTFEQNLLAETNDFMLVIDTEEDLSGLSDEIIATAAATADSKDMEGKWVFTTHKPSMIPFLQYSDKKELRKQLYTAYIMRGDNNNEHDNKAVISEMANLRVEKAHLLGFDSYAAYELDDRMAKSADKVYKLLDRVWEAAIPVAEQERADMQAMIDAEGGDFKLAPEDWWYYAEKLRKQKYDLDENELRPYFELNNVRDGVFMVTKKLFGMVFNKIESEFPKPHADAEAYEVSDADGTHLGVLYLDYYTRPTKSQGAWCGTYRDQSVVDGKDVRPIVTIVTNFANPVGDEPVLLSLDEVTTLFHEFGHGLHQLLSQCSYEGVSGTNVKRDFVELPSQILENWAVEEEVLALYAKHYETGEIIPAELIEKMKNTQYFNQGFATVEYVAASYLDMYYHVLEQHTEFDIDRMEQEYLDKIGLIPEIIPRYRSTYFMHIWSHGYTAGYYSYLWAEVLEKDAFEAFTQNGLFDENTARSFRENILERGGTANPMELYINFRGREPEIEPLLKSRGLL